MDDETKAVFETILAAKTLKSSRAKTKTSRSHYDAGWARGDRLDAMYPAWDAVSRPPEPPKPANDQDEGRCWERDDMLDPTTMNTKDQEAIISLDPAKAAAVLRTAYNPEFIARMKDTIPQTERRWDPVNKVWVFHPSALSKLKPLCEQYYKCVRVVGIQKQIPASKFDQLLAKLDVDDKQSIYIMLAKKYHPDTGCKDRTVMPLINTVFEK